MRDEVQMTIRVDRGLYDECKSKADDMGQTLAEWIRRAMREKLGVGGVTLPDSDLDAHIEAVVRRILAEEKAKTKS